MAYIGQTPTAVALDGDDLANDIITLAKMASGTDGNIISYDASGNPAYVATGTDGQVLTSTGAGSAPAFEALPSSGKVLQVLIVEDATTQTLATTTYTDTNLSLAITPSATSSKILCQWNMYVALAPDSGIGVKLLRDSTAVYTSTQLYDIYNYTPGVSSNPNMYGHFMHLDSPSSTSAITYKVQVGSVGGTSVAVNSSNMQTQLLLMEIGA